MRLGSFAIMLALALALPGCVEPAATRPTTGPLTVESVVSPALGVATSSAPATKTRPGPVTVRFSVDRQSVPAGVDVAFAVAALASDGSPASGPWVVRAVRGNSSAIVMGSGDQLPTTFVHAFPAAGAWVVTASVDVWDHDPASLALEVQVAKAAPAVPCAARPLGEPQVRPAVQLGPGDGEPNIVVAPDGTIYVTPVTNVYRSVDHGSTFQDLGTDKTEGHGDGDTAVDATGKLYWLGLGGGTPFQVSTDGGDSFSRPVDISRGTGRDREWLAVRPEGVAYATWKAKDDSVKATTSHDGGATWGPVVLLAEDGGAGNVFFGPAEGLVYEPLVLDGDIALARSMDDGTTWRHFPAVELRGAFVQDPLVGRVNGFPGGAADCAGNLYLVYSTPTADLATGVASERLAVYGVFMVSSHDNGETWGPPTRLSQPGKAAVMPWIAAGGPGRVAVVWYENQEGRPSENLPDTWDVKLWVSAEADAAEPEGVTLQLNGAPSHVGSICSSGLLCAAGGDRSLLDFFEVTLDEQGAPVAAWTSSIAGTGVGVAADGPDIWFGGAQGIDLR